MLGTLRGCCDFICYNDIVKRHCSKIILPPFHLSYATTLHRCTGMMEHIFLVHAHSLQNGTLLFSSKQLLLFQNIFTRKYAISHKNSGANLAPNNFSGAMIFMA